MERNTKCYISCPITGHDIEIVRSRISFAKDTLKKAEYESVSPLDVSPDQNATYAQHMGDDISALLECDAVYFIQGWHESKGCQAEYEIARIYEKKIMFDYV